jgi:hypothetical protein
MAPLAFEAFMADCGLCVGDREHRWSMGRRVVAGKLNLPTDVPASTARRSIMADDLKDRGAQDRSRVNVNEDHEVCYWTQKWGVSK